MTNSKGKFQETTILKCFYHSLFLLIGYLITGWFVGNNLLTFLFLFPFAAYTFFIHKEKRERLIIFITALLGPINEMIISSSGFFNYTFPTFIVPYWLPILWIIAAGLFLEISKYLISLRNKSQNVSISKTL